MDLSNYTKDIENSYKNIEMDVVEVCDSIYEFFSSFEFKILIMFHVELFEILLTHVHLGSISYSY